MTEYGIRELKYRVKENKLLTFEERKYINKALEEIQQYRAICPVEQLKTLQEDYWKINEISKEYSAIGTVEEFKTLKEKSEPKEPLCVSMAKDKDKNVGNIGRCPCCNDIVAEDMLWCDECGQKLDWS